jgi:hypothetical protein
MPLVVGRWAAAFVLGVVAYAVGFCAGLPLGVLTFRLLRSLDIIEGPTFPKSMCTRWLSQSRPLSP